MNASTPAPGPPESASPESAVDAFEALRPRLFGVAYRMTGSVSDADDVCQDAWLRWQSVDRSTVVSPEAFLVRTVTHLAIDRLRSAQHRRETYVGPYLPEPLIADDATATDPEAAAELADSVTLAFLVLLDELTPVERAVLLLHDVFGYGFDEVAGAVDRSPEACRQLASRTRRKVQRDRVDLRRSAFAEEQRLVDTVLTAIAAGDVEGLMALLAPDVVQLSDAGAGRHAARVPVIGPERVARLLVNVARRVPPESIARPVRVNGDPGVLFSLDGRADSVVSFAFAPDGRVRRIYIQLNPDKLQHLA